VFHCFTETLAVAETALQMGFHISFSGIVTFKNSLQVKEVASFVPLDRILVETDAPYLAPVPHRGKRNHPALVRHVADEVARLKGIDIEALAQATTANFFRLFGTAINA
jgi:TatD DNase family protein